MRRFPWLAALSVATALSAGSSDAASSKDALPSWSDGAGKQAVFEFVARVTTPGPGFVQPSERVALLDNDNVRQGRRSRYAAPIQQPKLELLAFLRSSGFRTVVVSGGEMELTRAYEKLTYGAPADLAMLQYTTGGDGPRLALLVHHVDGEPRARRLAGRGAAARIAPLPVKGLTRLPT